MYSLVMADNFMAPPVDGADDDPLALMTRIAQQQDRSALSALFVLLGPRVKSMMLKLGTGEALAEDLVQETFLTVWRKAHLYSPQRGAPSSWIFTIARNLRIDQVRRQSNKPYVELETVTLQSEDPIGSSAMEQQQIVARVSAAIENLPAQQQEVVRLSFVNDMTHADIAATTGIPLGTVKSRLRLAYERLRPLLEDLQ